MKPISDFYCKPANEAEAREIVERAVAHGAGLYEAPFAGEDVGCHVEWGQYTCWAVFKGRTHTQDEDYYTSQGIQLVTIDELLERAPLVSEFTEAETQAAIKLDDFPEMATVGWNLTWPDGNHGSPSQHIRCTYISGDNVVSVERWQAARRALYFAGMLKQTDEADAQIDAGTAALFANLTSPESAKAADKMFEDLAKAGTQEDEVNNPSHYASGDIECIDAIQASMSLDEFQGYCKGNVQKYMWRWRDKSGRQSLEKAQWYLNKMLEVTE